MSLQWWSHMIGELTPSLPSSCSSLSAEDPCFCSNGDYTPWVHHSIIQNCLDSRCNSITSIKKKKKGGKGRGEKGEKKEKKRKKREKRIWPQTLDQRMQTEPGILLRALWLYQLFTPPSPYDVVKTPNMSPALDEWFVSKSPTQFIFLMAFSLPCFYEY